MSENNGEFKPIVESLFEGMEHFLTSKTVFGDARTYGDTTIIPLLNVSFGVGAGAVQNEKKGNGGGGLGGKMTPEAVLVIQGDDVRILRLPSDKSLDRIMEAIPNVVSKVSSIIKPGKKEKGSAADKDSGNEFSDDVEE
jgi:uncharacterized spore protein YtfJ